MIRVFPACVYRLGFLTPFIMPNKYAFLGKFIDYHPMNWHDINNKLWSKRGRHFVYLLIKQDRVIYVGRTRNLYSRLYNHKYYFDFDRLMLFEYHNYNYCCKAEWRIIKYYKPVYNIRGI